MNFKHLHYFWVAAKAGGVMRAGEQLHTTPQTLSGQIKLLEEQFGHKLFRKSGRNLELTEAGRVALGYADQIFTLGAELETHVREARGATRVLEFRVGVADSVAKSMAYRLLEPALNMPQNTRLICSEGKFADLLAQLALHKLDLVLADEPMSSRVSVKAFNHPLGRTPASFFCTPELQAKLKGDFPQCLNGTPMLIQGAGTAIRQQFEAWLTKHQLNPKIVGEFDDGALIKEFGRQGRGVFMVPRVLEDEIKSQLNVHLIGRTDEMVNEFFAVSVERRISHPCVVAITETAREQLFSA
jgi:LysR family transcriptional activator of nhaA